MHNTIVSHVLIKRYSESVIQNYKQRPPAPLLMHLYQYYAPLLPVYMGKGAMGLCNTPPLSVQGVVGDNIDIGPGGTLKDSYS